MARGLTGAQLRRRLESIPKAIKAAARVAVVKGANEVADAQRRLAPVDEGDLRKSIRVEPGRHELQVIVKAGGPLTTRPVREGASAEYDYSLAQEFGITDAPAQPFFWPGYRTERKGVATRIKRSLGKAAKTTFGK